MKRKPKQSKVFSVRIRYDDIIRPDTQQIGSQLKTGSYFWFTPVWGGESQEVTGLEYDPVTMNEWEDCDEG